MKISYNWLKQYLQLDTNPEEIKEVLINIGLEVESLEEWYSIPGGLKKFVVGEVVECSKHPNADKLSITKVNIGKENLLSIVCGAPNVAKGQKVIVATIGSKINTPNGEIEIQKTKIRGEISEGMICAEDEIGIGTDHKGILVLPQDIPVGISAAELFNVQHDWIFEIGLTPNRIESASHLGIARELTAYFKHHKPVSLAKPDISDFKPDENTSSIKVSIENIKGCKRYSGVLIKGVVVKESPQWLKDRLIAIGLRPINNIVDITNYVLHETGQPLHAFDADKIIGNKVIVRTMPEGTPFVTLDGIERKLSAEDLMICNENEPMCLAGIFGGISSGISETTTNVFLESAYFNPVWIRKSSKRHDLHTDSSFRFERGTDPNGTIYALKRAALLIKKIAGGIITSDIIDIYPEPIHEHELDVQYNQINKLIGNTLPKEIIKNILESLEIKIIEEQNNTLKLRIPTYRVEVKQVADIVEEILRIYGYNNLAIPDVLCTALPYGSKNNPLSLQDQIADDLSANGFFEIMNNSLTKSLYYEKTDAFKDTIIYLVNPLSNDLNCMRQTLIFGALETIAYNINRKRNNLKLYEFGNCYSVQKKQHYNNPLEKYIEKLRLGIFITGQNFEPNWISPKEDVNFFQLKAYVNKVIQKAGLDTKNIVTIEIKHPLMNQAISYEIGGHSLANMGIINSQIVKEFDIKQPVFAAEIEWELLLKLVSNRKIQFQEIPKYPEVKRDLSLLLDSNITYQQLEKLAYKTEPKLIKKIILFDVYQGENIEKGKKSYALSFTIQSHDKTLTDQEIDTIMNKLIAAFEKNLGAKVRM